MKAKILITLLWAFLFAGLANASGYKQTHEQWYVNLSDSIGVEKFAENFNAYSDFRQYGAQITSVDYWKTEKDVSYWVLSTNVNGVSLIATSWTDGYLQRVYIFLRKEEFLESDAEDLIRSLLVLIFGGFAKQRSADMMAIVMMREAVTYVPAQFYDDDAKKTYYLIREYDPDVEIYELSARIWKRIN